MRRELFKSQEEDSYQEPNLHVPWSWSSQLSKLGEVNVCCLGHLIYGILLQQPELRQFSFLFYSPNQMLPFFYTFSTFIWWFPLFWRVSWVCWRYLIFQLHLFNETVLAIAIVHFSVGVDIHIVTEYTKAEFYLILQILSKHSYV